MSTTLTETCSCGATFCVTTPYAVDSKSAARAWREDHKHAEAVGICGDRPEVVGFPEDLPRPVCALKAGHAGWHGDGDGASWSVMRQAAAAPATERSADE